MSLWSATQTARAHGSSEFKPKSYFEVTKEYDGGYDAESDTENLSARGDTLGRTLREHPKTVDAYFHDGPKPQTVRPQHVR
jgi:hypothetical protein